LVTLIEYYIDNNNLPKTLDCIYSGMKLYLYNIAKIINTLDTYEVPISVGNDISGYVGQYHPLDVNFIGLKRGIEETYNKLKEML
jgi:hypothetical protein